MKPEDFAEDKRSRKERQRDEREEARKRFKPEPAGFAQGARIRKRK